MKAIKYIFFSVGVLLLLLSLWGYTNVRSFIKTANVTKGTVVDLYESESSSSSDNSYTYAPVVHFIDNKGNLIEFTSSSSSNPPSYHINERVEVLYDPESPDYARINGFFSLWGGSFIPGLLGFIFFAVGGGMILFSGRKKRRKEYLLQNGTRIESNIKEVRLNEVYSENGKHPFRIVSEWQDPETSNLHVFVSDNIWFDPTNYIHSDKIDVLIDRTKMKKYWVDLSPIMQLAEQNQQQNR